MVKRGPPPAPGPKPPKKTSVCVYDLSTDLNETRNLATDPRYAELVAGLLRKLKARGDTGPPLEVAFVPGVGMNNKTARAGLCAQENATGYLEPLDWRT